MPNLYTYDGSTWVEIAKNGTDGVDGKTLLNGSGTPSSGTGNDGDFYIDTTNNNLYGPKTSGAWGSATSIVGPSGSNGIDGAAATVTVGTTTTGSAGSSASVTNSGTTSAAVFDFTIPRGAAGTPGSVWYSGAGVPSTTHNNGDYYLNTSNGDVYEQVAGSWGSPIENLTGPTGASGSGSGNVTGPASSVVSNVAMFNNTTGTLLKDSGVTLSGSNTGDETATTIKSKLGITTLSGSNTGDQTNITGSAGSFTGNLAGDVTGTQSATVVGKINGTSLATLGTGILKNTTTTGVPSIAVAGDFPTLNQNTTGSAAKLTTARTVQTNLASTSSASFDGSANITPGITGTLAVGHGGTGATTLTGIVKGNGTGAMTAVTAPAGAIVGDTDTQTLSGKTLTSPVINTGTVGADPTVALGVASKQYIDNLVSSIAGSQTYGWQ